jgi:hypothetical protein
MKQPESIRFVPPGFWTKENCRKEALNYLTKKEFRHLSKSAYRAACKNKWIDEVCSHMKPVSARFPYGHWNVKENILQQAAKYPSISLFFKRCGSAYSAARKHGWLADVNKVY